MMGELPSDNFIMQYIIEVDGRKRELMATSYFLACYSNNCETMFFNKRGIYKWLRAEDAEKFLVF